MITDVISEFDSLNEQHSQDSGYLAYWSDWCCLGYVRRLPKRQRESCLHIFCRRPVEDIKNGYSRVCRLCGGLSR